MAGKPIRTPRRHTRGGPVHPYDRAIDTANPGLLPRAQFVGIDPQARQDVEQYAYNRSRTVKDVVTTAVRAYMVANP